MLSDQDVLMQLKGIGKTKHELKIILLVKYATTKKQHAYDILFKNIFIPFLLYKTADNGNNKHPT